MFSMIRALEMPMLNYLRRDKAAKIGLPIDLATLRQTGAWGAAALLAVVTVILTVASDDGSRRTRSILVGGPDPAPTSVAVAVVPPPQPALDRLTQRLNDTVKQMSAERDKLGERIASLERNLDDVTGSIKKAADLPPVTVKEPAPVLNTAPATTIAAAPPPTMIFTAIPPLPSGSPAAWPGTPATQNAATQPAAQTAPALPTAPVPLPQPRIAPDTTGSVVVDSDAASPAMAKDEIGVDLGGARSLDALTVHWANMKVKFGPLLTGLEPVVAIRERRPGLPELRLIAGPLADAEAATRLCITIATARLVCRPTAYAGQRLTQH